MSLATLEGGEEAFDPSMLGAADEVVQERVSDDELIFIKGTKARTASSIILRYGECFAECSRGGVKSSKSLHLLQWRQ
jgi:hypothetical protein